MLALDAKAAHCARAGTQAAAAKRVPRNHSSSFGLSRRRSSMVSHMPPPRRCVW